MRSAPRPDPKSSPAPRRRLLVLIGVLKLIKAALLILVGIGALELVGEDVGRVIRGWLRQMSADPDNRVIHAALEKIPALTPAQLRAVSAGTFVYAGLFLAEGVGLILRKRWGEYFTIVVTGLFLPLEIYEIVEKLTATRVAVLLANVAILVYLIGRLRKDRAEGSTRFEARSVSGTRT